MKKRILSIFLVLLLALAPTSICASAASYPVVMHKSIGLTGYIGDNIPLMFTYFPEYNYERIYVNVYSEDGTLCANSDFDINNKYSNYGSLTVDWDTSGYEAGTYKIEVEKEFYSFYNWNTAPTTNTSTVTLVEPTKEMSLNNTFKSSKTHFTSKVDTKVNAPKKGIKNAVSAWKKLNISNVKNPYTIQLTDMYIGDEAEKMAVEENMYNPNDQFNCQWTLLKFEIKNNGKKELYAGDTINWASAYLPSGHEITLIDTCTFGDLPDHDTTIAPGETKEAWFGFYTLKSQGLPFLQLDNGVYLNVNPNCAKNHKIKDSSVKATLSKDGKVSKKCSNCGWGTSTTKVKKVKTIKISKTSYVYNGKVQKPSVTVKDSAGKKLKKGTDYTVTYSKGCKNVGKYKTTVKLKGNYKGSKSFSFTINPPATKISKVKAGKTSLKVTVSKKKNQISGYQIQGSSSKKFKGAKTVTRKGYKATSYTFKGLKSNKTYFFRVRTFKSVNGKRYYSAWSSYKAKKTK